MMHESRKYLGQEEARILDHLICLDAARKVGQYENESGDTSNFYLTILGPADGQVISSKLFAPLMISCQVEARQKCRAKATEIYLNTL